MCKAKLYKSVPAILILLQLFSLTAFSQTKALLSNSKKLYEGNWVNRKNQRHLSIAYDKAGYAEINDWHGKYTQDNNTIDVYKAWIEKNKLIMPESKTDLRCPYCEIVRNGNSLLYRCRGMFTKDKRFIENILFVREKQ
jgi:hypothetical protein